MEMVIDTYGHTWNDRFCTFHLLFIERLFTKRNERFGLQEPWGWPKRIVNPLSGGGLIRLFSTHPPIKERIKRLEEMAMRV